MQPDRPEELSLFLGEQVRTATTQARDRYAALLLQAMSDLAENPARAAARIEPGIDPTIGFHHVRHSRRRVVVLPRFVEPG